MWSKLSESLSQRSAWLRNEGRTPGTKRLPEPLVKNQETQTLMGELEMKYLDTTGEWLGDVLDFYVKHSGTAFQDQLMIAASE